MIHPPSLLLGGILVASLAVSGFAMAQETPTTAAESIEVAIGGFRFELDDREPVLDLPVSRTTNGDGAFVSHYLAVQRPDGSYGGATPCDDLAVPCLPFTSPAKGGLRTADNGDQIPLAGDGQ